MSFFKQIEGDAAVLVTNGVYSQTDLYERDGYLYAKTGGGFVRLMADGSTSKSRTRLDFLSFDGLLYRDSLGRLAASELRGKKTYRLEDDKVQKLLGGGA